ncbi:DUF1570 domain-containing protein [Fontivita pretiosa]|uniref:DUF1570 domain-containing protein n=1 Tax=Fontivita pretiosa TaxID=2989684 RepID=UPI003D17CDE2
MQSSQNLRALIRRVCAVCLLWPVCAWAQMRTLDTPHYRIHTDLDKRLAEDLALRMEAMYREYSLRLASFGADTPNQNRFQVYLFTLRSDYSEFTGDRLPNTGGVFIPRRNLLAGFLEGQGRDGLRRTLQHEAFHQFAYTVIGPNLPAWLNEGIAQVFEEGLWTGRQFIIGQVPPRRLRQLQHDLANQNLIDFRRILTMTDQQWNQALADPARAAIHYSQAWGMVHFLVFAPDESGRPKYRARLVEMLRLLHAGHSAPDAFVAAFSDNIDGFQDRFVEYARTLQPTPQATFLEYQRILGDMLVMLEAREQRFEDAVQFRDYLIAGGLRLRYSKGQVQWSTETDPRVYFLDAQGRLMNSEQLLFSPRGGAPLPDLIARPIDGFQFRTIFHYAPTPPANKSGAPNRQIEHETIIESR